MAVRVGGRPRQIERADIIRAGREVGLADLTMGAVASRLGVTTTALYRHVDSRWTLEQLVGESILGDLELREDPAHDTARHLLSVCLQLRTHLLDHPGLARYVQTLFPRGEGGRRLLASQAEALVRRGYAQDAAIVLCSAAASVLIGYAATEDAQRDDATGLTQQREHAEAGILSDPQLAQAHVSLPVVSPQDYVRVWLGCAIRAFVEAAPPGRPVEEIWSVLDAAAEVA